MQHRTDKSNPNIVPQQQQQQPQSQQQRPIAFQFAALPWSSSTFLTGGAFSGMKPPRHMYRQHVTITRLSPPHCPPTMNSDNPPSSSVPSDANGASSSPPSPSLSQSAKGRPSPRVSIGSFTSKSSSSLPTSTSNVTVTTTNLSPQSTIPVSVSSDPVDQGFGHSVTLDEMMQSLHGSSDPLWQLIRHEAKHAAKAEPQLASSLYGDILVHRSLEDTLSTVLANALHTDTFQATQWVGLFEDALTSDTQFPRQVRADISAFMQRDPATTHALRVLLHAKGFQALQSWRLANWLWKQGRISLAFFLQSRISSTFAVDIHPAATIGSGVLIDHGTGIVIGETAKIGNNVSILHNVTLGGTGKESGDRHPKVADGVMIGAGATILGNIHVGTCAHVAACSVVLKPVEPYAVVSGVPAKVVGKVSYNAGLMPSFIMDQRLSLQVVGDSNPYQHVVTGNVKASAAATEDECVDIGGGV